MSDHPKIDMVTAYLLKHYPDHGERLARNPLIATAVMSPEYSNSQIEDIIDKVAMLQNLTKKEAA